jgi:hypothetical protein
MGARERRMGRKKTSTACIQVLALRCRPAEPCWSLLGRRLTTAESGSGLGLAEDIEILGIPCGG